MGKMIVNSGTEITGNSLVYGSQNQIDISLVLQTGVFVIYSVYLAALRLGEQNGVAKLGQRWLPQKVLFI